MSETYAFDGQVDETVSHTPNTVVGEGQVWAVNHNSSNTEQSSSEKDTHVLEPTDRELLLSLHAKMDAIAALTTQHVLPRMDAMLEGLNATYTGVGQIQQLLSGVQQVAANLPGPWGKKARETMANMAAQNGFNPNGVQQ